MHSGFCDCMRLQEQRSSCRDRQPAAEVKALIHLKVWKNCLCHFWESLNSTKVVFFFSVEHLISHTGVRSNLDAKKTFIMVGVALTYLTLAGGTGWVGHMPCVPAEAEDACGVLARLPDVIRQVVGQAGVCDAARATLALRHRRVLTHQHGANQRPAVHLPLLHRHTERWNTKKKRRQMWLCALFFLFVNHMIWQLHLQLTCWLLPHL